MPFLHWLSLCGILSSICTGKELTLQEPEDVEFFISAMKRCCQNHHDTELAYRIDRLVNTGNNRALLGDSRLESMYYLFFMHLICTFETMDKIMEVILSVEWLSFSELSQVNKWSIYVFVFCVNKEFAPKVLFLYSESYARSYTVKCMTFLYQPHLLKVLLLLSVWFNYIDLLGMQIYTC